jgi:hypothetical protein
MRALLQIVLRSFRADAFFGATRGCAKPPPRAESSNAFGVSGVSDKPGGFVVTIDHATAYPRASGSLLPAN